MALTCGFEDIPAQYGAQSGWLSLGVVWTPVQGLRGITSDTIPPDQVLEFGSWTSPGWLVLMGQPNDPGADLMTAFPISLFTP